MRKRRKQLPTKTNEKNCLEGACGDKNRAYDIVCLTAPRLKFPIQKKATKLLEREGGVKRGGMRLRGGGKPFMRAVEKGFQGELTVL